MDILFFNSTNFLCAFVLKLEFWIIESKINENEMDMLILFQIITVILNNTINDSHDIFWGK